ncbi:MAG: restriction endonuclease subunit S, partial [Actinomycetaceae bacterium]|nr:restriction endonuclease subunit S [Actinomycetaceae bacterium]
YRRENCPDRSPPGGERMIADKLRAAVLQAAMQGKLTDHCHGEQSVSEFLTENGIKEQRPQKHPFLISERYRWVTLGDLTEFRIGKTPRRNETIYWSKGTVPWVSISDMKQGEWVVNTKEKVSETAVSKVFGNRISPKGCLIMSFKLTIGRCSFLGVDAVHNEAIISIFPKGQSPEVASRYLSYILPIIAGSGEFKGAIKGKTLNKASLSSLMIPIPPVAEQERIVAKLEKLMPLIDQLAELERERENLDRTFFKALEAAILQAATSGHLTLQHPEDGTAADLLADIARDKKSLIEAGKLKKQKPLPPVTEDEQPFEVPKSWMWTRLGELASAKSGKATVLNPPTEFNAIPVYGGNGIAGYTDTARVARSTLVVGRVGYYCGAVHETQSEAWVSDNALEILLHSADLSVKFMYHLLCWGNLGSSSVSTAQPVISGARIYPILMPLPPVAEQERIVAKLDAVLPLVRELQETLA